MISESTIKSEKGLRSMIERNLNKEIHSSTKSSVDFVFKILEDAYNSGLKYDVSDMRQTIFKFAMHSTNQSEYCMKLVGKMHFKSEEISEPVDAKKDKLVFFDCEVFPNLLLVVWKFQGVDRYHELYNPTSQQIEELFEYKLVGFNNLAYDNYILYARYVGYSIEEIFRLSQQLIAKDTRPFREALNISYTDVRDFSTNKQSLKKWEIELGLHHQECPYEWDKPVDEEHWHKIAEYCKNDVYATEKVFEHNEADWMARQMLASIAGGKVNERTNALCIKFLFGSERRPKLIYTDLATGAQY